ncbi:hypothetical protein ACQE98_09025 [Ornithinimicrobium sp. W1679]|uniref:hypothetical protein n=1 Tax=Ornithinimicrobium sp. W1679 TaxID=3418770 RepID=UPI003CE77647
MTLESAAAPWPEDEPDPQPQLRAGLEALGFRLLGAQVLTDPEAVVTLAEDYPADQGAELIEHGVRPAQVLRAPDGSAFARLAWFWSGTYGELTTVLVDGDVVTTVTDWNVDPPWPSAVAASYDRTTDRRQEQEQYFAQSRSVRIVDGDAAALWAEHERHVASLAPLRTLVPRHTSLQDAVAVYTYAQQARERRNLRSRLMALALWAVLLLGAWLVLDLATPLNLAAKLLVVVVLAVGVGVVHPYVWVRLRHRPGPGPRHGAPVPSGPTVGTAPD